LFEALDGLCLHIKDAALAQQIYDAMWGTQSFRIVVNGANVVSIPTNSATQHAGTDTVLISNNDVEWDDAGCLVIKDHQLGQKIVRAQADKCFRISMNKNDVAGAGGTIEGNKVNGMCNC
jgi:hypothetical protein